jgi:hypothetical protein
VSGRVTRDRADRLAVRRLVRAPPPPCVVGHQRVRLADGEPTRRGELARRLAD